MLWHEKVATYGTATIPTPIFHDNCVYVTAGYGAGCGLVKLTPDGKGGLKSEVVYTKKVMENQHGGVVLVGDHVYGSDDSKGLTCQEFKTGKVTWSPRRRSERVARRGRRLPVLLRPKDGGDRVRRGVAERVRGEGPVHDPEEVGQAEAVRRHLDAPGHRRRQAVPAGPGTAVLLRPAGRKAGGE